MIDVTDPEITLNGDADITLECGESYVEQGAEASDSCGDADVTIDGTVDDGTAGTYELTYTATDGAGNEASVTRTVTVADTSDPVVTLNGDDPVNLECGESYVEAGATATDSCGDADVTIDGSVDDGTPGSYVLTYTATDDAGNEASVTRTVNVGDNTPPEITVAGDPIVLWPPNHSYHTIGLGDFVTGTDDSCGSVSVTLSAVSSDEPEDVGGGGDGHTYDDIVLAGDCSSVDVRSERQGGGNGRVYTLTATATDDAGNSASADFEVWVPKSKKSGAVNDGPAYSETCGGGPV